MATLAMSYIGTDGWNADVYGALSFASRLAEAVKERRIAYQVGYFFWRVNARIESLLNDIHRNIEKAREEAERGGTRPAAEAAEPARIKNAIDSLHRLHTLLDGIYQTAVRYRLTNHSALASSVHKLHRNDERIVELMEWIIDLTDSESLEKIFAEARAEFDRGETVALAE